MHYQSGAGGFYQSTPTSRPLTAPFSPICPIRSCSPPRFLHRRHGWRNPLPQLHPRLHDGRRGQQAPGSPSRARLPSCGRHYCCAACSGAPLHPPEARPARKVLKDQQRTPEEDQQIYIIFVTETWVPPVSAGYSLVLYRFLMTLIIFGLNPKQK